MRNAFNALFNEMGNRKVVPAYLFLTTGGTEFSHKGVTTGGTKRGGFIGWYHNLTHNIIDNIQLNTAFVILISIAAFVHALSKLVPEGQVPIILW